VLFFSVSRWLFSVMIFLYATGENWKKSLTNGIFSEKYIEYGLRTGQTFSKHNGATAFFYNPFTDTFRLCSS